MRVARLRRAAIAAVRELRVLKKLTTPRKIQDFLDRIPMNMETTGDTCSSPLVTLRRNSAHCMEGALVAALALAIQGQKPLLLDLKTTTDDIDHVVALYRKGRFWGAISKTNHSVLRYREPIYRDVRELAVSYFHEYFSDSGRKSLRQFSEPFDLRKWKGDWATTEDELWDLAAALDFSPHESILSRQQIAVLRKVDDIELSAGELTEWS
jgi:hypothetical protein